MKDDQLPQSIPATATQMISRFSEPEYKSKFEVALADEFLKYEQKAQELVNTSGTITVNNSEELAIAKSRIIDTKSWLKMLEDNHKTVKSPILAIGKMIDAKKKAIEDNIEKAKKTIEGKITFYETIEKRNEAARLQKVKEEQEKTNALVLADTQKINQIVMNIKSLLYGGVIKNSKGEFQVNGAFDLDAVQKVEETIKRSIPAAGMFREECLNAYNEAMSLIGDMVVTRKQSLLVSGGTVLSAQETAVLAETHTIMANQVQRNMRTEEKIDRAIGKTDLGFRRTIVAEVFNLDQVPREFLCLDEAKINQWKIDHREEILEGLKKNEISGKGFIAGIKFRVEQTSIVR